jgi:hypothetical protein
MGGVDSCHSYFGGEIGVVLFVTGINIAQGQDSLFEELVQASKLLSATAEIPHITRFHLPIAIAAKTGSHCTKTAHKTCQVHPIPIPCLPNGAVICSCQGRTSPLTTMLPSRLP